jgi:6,7-dimethyl-8-ribityllumazine synthase
MSRIAIVAAEFNRAILDPMVAFARDEAAVLGLSVEREVRVPGSFEIPLVTAALLGKHKIDAVVVLGYLEKGETLHGEVLGHVVYRALVDLQIEHGKPVGLGIIGPGATHPQAEARREGHARAAVRAIAATFANLAAIDSKVEKAEKAPAEKSEKSEKAEKAEKPANSEKPSKAEPVGAAAAPSKSTTEPTEKSAKPDKSAKKAAKAEKKAAKKAAKANK